MPLARVHALWTLEGLESLSDADLAVAIKDADPHVREQAIGIAESRLSSSSALLELIIDAATDDDKRVRFQVAFTLGEVDDERAINALATIARRDADDSLMRTAVMSSASRCDAKLLKMLLQAASFSESKHGLETISQLALMVGSSGDLSRADELLVSVSNRSEPVQAEVLRSLADGLRRAKQDLAALMGNQEFASGPWIASMLDDAATSAVDTSSTIEQRQQAIALLGYGSYRDVKPVLTELLSIQQPPALQSAAISSLVGTAHPEIAALLLERFPSLTPVAQAEIINRLLQRAVWIPDVLDAVAEHRVPAKLIPANLRVAYMKSPSPAIQQRASKLFAADLPSPRGEVLDRYRVALSIAGDPQRGAEVFRKNCQSCHRFNSLGFEVGPNLATIQSRTPGQLLVNILDPSREVSPDFLEYIALANDGRIIRGIIASENANSVTLRQAEGAEATIQRSDIDTIQSTGKSLMPDGIEATITPPEMADLISYLRSLGMN